MKAGVEVADRKEANLIRRGLADPETRALVKTMGALLTMPTDRARARALWFVQDQFEERKNAK